MKELSAHRAWLEGTEPGRARRKERLAEEVREGLREALIDAATHALGGAMDAAVIAVDERQVDPYTATEGLIETFRASRLTPREG